MGVLQMKTKFFWILIAVLLGGLAVSCSKSKKEQKEQITVNIGTQTYAEVVIAEVKGFFKEELAPLNAATKIATFQSGPPEVEALAAKSLDFAVLGDQPALQAVSSGVPVKIISGILDGAEGFGLLARADAGIKSVKDIKGKKIASPAGTNAYLLLLTFLEKEGLTLDDIQYVNLAIGSITPSLITGDIEGAVAFGTTFSYPPEEEGIIKVHSGVGYKQNVQVVLARTEYTQKYPDITVAVLKALQKAAKWRVDNYDESIDIIAEWAGVERDVIIKSLNDYITLLKLDQGAQNALLVSADLLYRSDIIAEKLTAENIFDLKFQEQAGLETYPGWGAERVKQ